MDLASSRRPNLDSSADTNLLSPAGRPVRVCNRIVASMLESSAHAWSNTPAVIADSAADLHLQKICPHLDCLVA